MEANREVLDRYGRKLVTNRLSYNLSFDWDVVPSDEQNEIILHMIDLCEEKDIEYNVSLPIKYYVNGYRYIGNGEGTDWKRFKNTWMQRVDEDIPAGSDRKAEDQRVRRRP